MILSAGCVATSTQWRPHTPGSWRAAVPGGGDGSLTAYWGGQDFRSLFLDDGSSTAYLSLTSFKTVLLGLYCGSCHINVLF